MTLKERFQAEETKVGKFLKNIVGKGLLVCSALGAANEYLVLVPVDFIPQWLKTVVVVAGVVGLVAGKMTAKPNQVL